MEVVYKEVRGVMTHFEPLTEEALSKRGVEGLSFEELKELRHGNLGGINGHEK